MRLPRVRFKVRQLMTAVAIVAATSASVQMGYRSWHYRASYLESTAYERSWRHMVDEPAHFHHRSRMTPEEIARQSDNRRAFRLRNAEHYAELKRKYQYAMWHPWIAVLPDPEPPE